MIASWVERLLELQSIDMEIRSMKTRLVLIPKEKESLKTQLAAAEAGIKAAREEVRAAELAIKAAESAIAQKEAHIQKLQQQTAMVKKNTEYQAMLAEIDSDRAGIGELESNCLEAMDRLENAQRQLKVVTRENEAEIANRSTDIEELTAVEAELKEEIVRLTAAREAPRKLVNPSLLNRYEQIERRGSGIPVAEVKEDGFCGNCRLRLTPQSMSDVKGSQVAYCDNCMHIIYMDVDGIVTKG